MNQKNIALLYVGCSAAAIVFSTAALVMSAYSDSESWIKAIITSPALFGLALGAATLPFNWKKFRSNTAL